MLVLARRPNERVVLDLSALLEKVAEQGIPEGCEEIELVITSITPTKVGLGIGAHRIVDIYRSELGLRAHECTGIDRDDEPEKFLD